MAVKLHSVQRTDIDILGVGRAGMHPDPAGDDDPRIGLAQASLSASAIRRVGAQPVA